MTHNFRSVRASSCQPVNRPLLRRKRSLGTRPASRRLRYERLEGRELLNADPYFVRVRFDFTNEAGTSLTSLSVGDEFFLNVYIQDPRLFPEGVLKAYFNLGFDETKASGNGALVHGPDYLTDYSGTIVAGSIEDAGGIDTDRAPPLFPGNEFLLFTAPMRADATGTLELVPSLADSPHTVECFDTFELRLDQIDFGDRDIEIAGGGLVPTIASLSDSPDPVTRPGSLTLTANGVADTDGAVASVAFYRETNGTAGLQAGAGGDTLLGTDTNGADGWSVVASTAGLSSGDHTYYAQATDDVGLKSAAAATTNTLVNPNPTIGSLGISPQPVTRPSNVTLTANSVSDPDGSVASVAFYRETNGVAGLQTGSGGDTLVGTDSSSSGGWTFSASTTGLATGDHIYYAQATDNDGGKSAVGDLAPSVTSTVQNALPVVGSLVDTPDPVARPNTITLTAQSVADADGSIASVAFYRETNGTTGLQTGAGGDTLLGVDASSDGGWSVGASTAGLAPGAYTYYAQATDNDGGASAIASTTNTVSNLPPTIGALTDAPDPVIRPGNLTLTAQTVADADGTVASLAFYRETNGTAGLQLGVGGDTLVGTDNNGADGWAASIATSGLALGSHTYYAQATDNDGGTSAAGVSAPSTTSVAQNSLPVVGSLTDAPDPASRPATVTLTAGGVSDADGSIVSVAFYRETNGTAGLQTGAGGDTVLGSDTNSADGWTFIVATAGLAPGGYNYYALATDNDGGTSATGALAPSASNTVLNALPAIGSLLAAPAPATRLQDITLTAQDVADPDGTIASVAFYRETNGTAGLQTGAGGDTLVGTDSSSSGGWTLAVSAAGLALGSHTFYAQATDNDNGASAGGGSAPSTTVSVVNLAPTIGSLVDNPDPVTRPNNITLTASDVVDADGSVAGVSFYRETNGVAGLQTDAEGDTLVGNDSSSSGGWAITFASTGLALGSHTYYAQAVDNNGTVSSAAPSASHTVLNASPAIGSLSGDANPVVRPNSLTLTAAGVMDPDGSVTSVAFYRETNGVAGLQTGAGGDLPIGTDSDMAGGWTASISTGGLGLGPHTFYAQATDSDGAASAAGESAAATTITVQNALPVVGSVTASPDPVLRTGVLTLTAVDVSDPDGSVASVAFYRETNGIAGLQTDAGGDTLLDTDTSFVEDWSIDVSMTGLSLGPHTYYAQATDNDGGTSASGVAAPVATSTVANVPPVVATLEVAPNPVTRPNTITLTAVGASDADGTIAAVEFYRESNAIAGLQTGAGGDTLVGTDASSDGGWTATVDTAGLSVGGHLYYARAIDNDGGATDDGAAATATSTVENAIPTIGALSGSPDPVTRPNSITLTADAVSDPDGSVVSVAFYRETNGTDGLQTGSGGDTLVGTDTDSAGGWTATVSTAGLGLGPQTYYAQATDDDSGPSAEGTSAPTATLTIQNALPTIGSLVDNPDPVTIPNSIHLTAVDVVDPDGSIASMAFYQESNGIAGLQTGSGGDTMLGADTTSAGGWTISFSSTGLAEGTTYTYYAQATDNDGGTSAGDVGAVSTDNMVLQNDAPTITSLSDTPDPVVRPNDILLTAEGVADSDGTVVRVDFYRETNGLPGLQVVGESDTLVGTDTGAGDGWSATVDTSAMSAGPSTYYALATDDLGGMSPDGTDAPSTVNTIDNLLPVIAGLSDTPDPLTRPESLTLTASGVNDPDGTVTQVAFYRESNDQPGLQTGAGGDTLVGTDTDSDGGWTATVETAGLPPGDHVYYAQVTDHDGGTSPEGIEAPQTTNTITSLPPAIDALTVDPDPAVRPTQVTLTAVGVVDPDGTVASVAFYRETNGAVGLQTGDGGDTLVGTDLSSADGWTSTFSSGALGLGTHTYYAQATDGDGETSAVASVSHTIENATPVIGSLAGVPNPASRPDNVTLTADSVTDPDGTVASVAFYHETNGEAGLQIGDGGDTLVSVDSDDTDGWTASVATAALALGSHTFYALATDNDGGTSPEGPSAASSVLAVQNALPEIVAFAAAPDPVTRLASVTLTASGVADADGTVASVAFYRETNGVAGLQTGAGGDTLVGTDSDDTDGWEATFSAAGLALGTQTYYAQALDNDGGLSTAVTATNSVENVSPAVASLVGSPNPVTRPDTITLTAGGVTDSDGTVAGVAFYRETNGIAGLQTGTGGDTSVGDDVDGSNGWSLVLSTADLPLGTHTYYAQAADNDAGKSAEGSGAPATGITVENAAPTIGSLGDSPDPVTRPATVTLTATTVADADGTIASVAFYRETNGTAGLQTGAGGDTLVGTDTNGADGWSYGVSTAGFASGTHTYYAQATDNNGGKSADGAAAASTTSTVLHSPPTIGALGDSPDPVARPASVTLTATGVADPDGTVVSVKFYRESNGQAGLQTGTGGDTLIGTDTTGDDGWTQTVATEGLAPGVSTYYAQATDNDGDTSADGTSAASTTNTIQNVLPTIASLADTPDPATRPASITLTAAGVVDQDGTIVSVAFYRESNGQIGLQTGAGGDTIVGTDADSAGGWSVDFDTEGLSAGTYTYYAQATDNDGGKSSDGAGAASTTNLIQNVLPTIGSITDTPDPVTRPASITLTAVDVNDADGSVANVQFYRETNAQAGLQTGAGGDTLVGTDDSSEGGWSVTVSTSGLAAGTHTYYAQATDSDGGKSGEGAAAPSTTSTIENALPTIGSLSDAPDPAVRPASVTLTANAVVDPDGTIAGVAFYRESNGQAGLQTGAGGDTLLGTDTNGDGGWTHTFATGELAPGTSTYYAQATDDSGAKSAGGTETPSTTNTVENALPTIGSLIDAPDPVTRPANLTLTAGSVNDADGTIASVAFYRESNGTAGLQTGTGGDTLLSTDTSGADGWAYTFATSGLTLGSHTYYAQATDDLGAKSPEGTSAPSTTNTVQNALPTVGSLTDSPDPATRPASVTLTAGDVADADGTIASVAFYRETNGTAGLQTGTGGDTLVGTDNESAGGWTVSFATSGLTVGSHTYYAQAADNDGGKSADGASARSTTHTVQNALPTISNVADQNVNEDTPTAALSFTISDVETAVGTLTVAGTSSDTTLVPNANIQISGSGASRTVTVTPAANRSGTATITLTVTDADGGTATDTFVLTVAAVNDAPVLNNSGDAKLKTIDKAPASDTGTLISELIGSVSSLDMITDPDNGAQEGIAVLGVDNTHGHWQYSLDNGATFQDFSATRGSLVEFPASARLLASNGTNRIRFVPDSDFTGLVASGVTFRAWDQTSGTVGATADLSASSATGGSAAYSTATETASIVVGGGLISGRVVIDTNNDGQYQDGVEQALAGVTVTLTGTDSSGKSVNRETTTDTDGQFSFKDLPAGTYTVAQTQPAGYLDGKLWRQNGSSNQPVSGSNAFSGVVVAAGQELTGYHFAEQGMAPTAFSKRLALPTVKPGTQVWKAAFDQWVAAWGGKTSTSSASTFAATEAATSVATSEAAHSDSAAQATDESDDSPTAISPPEVPDWSDAPSQTVDDDLLMALAADQASSQEKKAADSILEDDASWLDPRLEE